MSQEVGQAELKAKTQQLLDGPLKHIRAAAIAAALLPLASVAPASAQPATCGSGGVCGVVFNDTNNNGIQDSGEPGISLAKVTLLDSGGGTVGPIETNPDGTFEFGPLPPGTYTVGVQIPSGMQVNVTGVKDQAGFSAVTTTLETANLFAINFGFITAPTQGPGTGTPGYWKNHPEAWPVQSITIGGVSYLKADAITALSKITKDKTTTMFSSLLSAKLNLLIGNDDSCLISSYGSTIALADAWMTAPPIGYGPLGSGVAASSAAWKIGEPLHQTMDAYNNGLLCAPHRQ